MGESGEVMLAQGGYERVTDYGEAIEQCLGELEDDGCVVHRGEIEAVGFKAVLGRNLTGCVIADETVIDALEGFAQVAPAHNPAYADGIRQFSLRLPGAMRVALFETAYYQWAADSSRRYAVPQSWYDAGIQRHGFHGASHKYVAERSAELMGRMDVVDRVRRLYVDGPIPVSGSPLRVISCHLGGSSSIAGICDGVAIGCSLGFSPQSGLPHNNRVGDLDSMAIPFAMRTLGLSLEDVERDLSREGGLWGLSGVSNDMRDIREAAQQGNPQAQLALDTLAHEIRHWIGAFFLELNGCDVLVFTAGIGENNPELRENVCRNLDALGILLDMDRNREAFANEAVISQADSATRIVVMPTNEELVVARETYRLVNAVGHRTTAA